MPSKGLHIAIIPDGNRRWAKKKGLLAWNGHEKSAENFRSLLEWCVKDERISVLTFWAFSTENWKRDEKEVTKIMKLLERHLREERAMLKEKKIRLVHSGRTDRLSASILQLLNEMSTDTTSDPAFIFHLALDYGGKDEVVRAVQRMVGNSEISEEAIRNHLDHPELPDIDLIIRTSGEMRTSNFFLWQSTYSEWVYPKKFFPDFTTDDLQEVIDAYEKRSRRFGS